MRQSNNKKSGYGIWELAHLFPAYQVKAQRGTEYMEDKERAGKKRIHIRTAIVAILFAIAAFLCFYFWSVPYAAMMLGIMAIASILFGFICYGILYMVHCSKESKAFDEASQFIKDNVGKLEDTSGETPDSRFKTYCEDLAVHTTTRKVWLRNAIIFFWVAAIAFLLFAGLKPTTGPVDPTPTVDVTLDPNVTDPIQTDKQEEIDRLNKKLEEGYITFSINKSPVFNSGDSEGNLNIINLEENNYPQMVELYMLDKNGKLIYDANGDATEKLYQSGIIPVGKSIPYAKLDVHLDAGEYQVMAVIHAVSGETGQVLGTVNTPLKLTVLK